MLSQQNTFIRKSTDKVNILEEWVSNSHFYIEEKVDWMGGGKGFNLTTTFLRASEGVLGRFPDWNIQDLP